VLASGEQLVPTTQRLTGALFCAGVYPHAAILATVAYEYIVPNNLLWAVVVPAVFLAWQTGSVPGPMNMEFWLIGW
jgi:hypothetical protein